jgi:hypothetical protein
MEKSLKRLNELEMAEQALKVMKLLNGLTIGDAQEVIRTAEVFISSSARVNIECEEFKALLKDTEGWRSSSDSMN